MILLPLRSTSNKPWQNTIPKDPPIKPSRTARKAVSQPTLQANDPQSDLRCAEHPSAHESGIFELLRQLYPARLLFFAVEKKDENANNLSV